jgi:hypothetical protein
MKKSRRKKPLISDLIGGEELRGIEAHLDEFKREMVEIKKQLGGKEKKSSAGKQVPQRNIKEKVLLEKVKNQKGKRILKQF